MTLLAPLRAIAEQAAARKAAPPPDNGPLGALSDLPESQLEPVPAGLPVDPTYLAFLRGAGMDQQTAWATAQRNIAAANAQYHTGVTREPALLDQGIRGVNGTYSANNNFFSGGRLTDVAHQRVLGQQRLADLATARAQGIGGEQQTLDATLEQIQRANADEIANLQARRDAQTNEDRYIGAVGQANSPQAAQSTGTDPITQYLQSQGVLAPAPAPAAAPGAPATGTDPTLAALQGLNPQQAAAFRLWVNGQPKPPAPPKPTPTPGVTGAQGPAPGANQYGPLR